MKDFSRRNFFHLTGAGALLPPPRVSFASMLSSSIPLQCPRLPSFLSRIARQSVW